MNIDLPLNEDSIIVVDYCGLAFRRTTCWVSIWAIPDVTYLKNNIDKVKGLLDAHGHEDHIGARCRMCSKRSIFVYTTEADVGRGY